MIRGCGSKILLIPLLIISLNYYWDKILNNSGMENKKKFVIIISGILFIIIVFVVFLPKETKQNVNLTASDVNSTAFISSEQKRQSDIFKLTKKDQNGNKIYESNVYNFSITLNKTFSYRLELDEVDTSNMKFSISFFSPNDNTSDKVNRDTPNGFNFSADNALGLHIYDNSQNINASEILKFKNWYKGNVIGRGIINFEQDEINDKQVLILLESDGIDSIGQYFYFFREKYIFVLGSDDFTKQEIFAITNSFIY